MLRLIFLLIAVALFAGLFGFGGLSHGAAAAASFVGWLLLAKIVIGVVIFGIVASMIMNLFNNNRTSSL